MYVGSRLGRAQNSKISDDPRRVVLFSGLEELVRDLVLRIGRQSGAAFPAALCSKGVRLLVAMGSLIVGLATQARAGCFKAFQQGLQLAPKRLVALNREVEAEGGFTVSLI